MREKEIWMWLSYLETRAERAAELFAEAHEHTTEAGGILEEIEEEGSVIVEDAKNMEESVSEKMSQALTTMGIEAALDDVRKIQGLLMDLVEFSKKLRKELSKVG